MSVEIKVPAMGESVTEGEITEWLKAEGDAVEADETIVVIETDKITVDLPSPATGVLAKIAKAAGSVVAIGEVIGVIDETAETAAAPAGKKPEPAAPQPSDEETRLSPAVRRLVEEAGIDAAKVSGTGKGGRLLKSDVLDYLEKTGAEKELVVGADEPAESKPAAPASPPGRREEERVRMTRIRQRTAERLLESQRQTASLTTFNDVDMTEIFALRGQYKEAFKEKYGISLGFMGFFIKACIEALKAFPAINAMIDGDDIVYRNYYDIGVAVSADKGLVVPVIRNAEALSFAETERAVADLAKRARDGKLSIEELTGGTFSLSNGGVFGSLLSTPILNPPQSGILGMHRIEKRPVVVSDQIVIRPMMYLALTYDHRIVDGREAVSFLVRVKQCIEQPARMLLEV